MYLKQAELFRGISMDFLKKVMDVTQRESHPGGTVLFHAGDPAEYFYIFINGQVELLTGGAGGQTFVCRQTGGSFGCARLFGLDSYAASANCTDRTDLLKVDVHRFRGLLDRYVADGFLFYRNLSEVLGKRLMQSYRGKPNDWETA